MTTVSELQELVASRYELLDLPAWPNPHPGCAEPRDDEYSRLTDPGRYRIVHARARTWAAVLQSALGARSEVLTPAPTADAGTRPFDRGVRLVPPQPDALPLLFLERDVPTREDAGPLAVLTVAVARPEIVVETQPDCGCDACDSGSSDLLEAVDEAVRRVVGGPFVVLRGKNWQADWHPEGGGAGGRGDRPDFRAIMELCRRLAEGETVRLPRNTEALVGRSWIR